MAGDTKSVKRVVADLQRLGFGNPGPHWTPPTQGRRAACKPAVFSPPLDNGARRHKKKANSNESAVTPQKRRTVATKREPKVKHAPSEQDEAVAMLLFLLSGGRAQPISEGIES